MNIQPTHPNFLMPQYGSEGAGAMDLFMPEGGSVFVEDDQPVRVGLGFKAAVPPGHVALLLPRSGKGANHGLELNNTCGVIDSDYRGEWMAVFRTKSGEAFTWEAGERLFQALIVPVCNVTLQKVNELGETSRGRGGFGSTGN